ncbi:MAG: hypothetical protein HYR91_07395 [Flavobacteriia bacterium]|nr:hypothetical protein [Flavobacteriia bacterium]
MLLKYFISILLVGFTFVSCCSGIPKKKKANQKTKFISIEEVIKEKNSNWAFSNCGVSSSILHFNFKTFNRLTLEFAPDCNVIFPITIHHHKIEVYWRPEILSSKEYDIIKLMKRHTVNKVFMRLTLQNDSTISVKYYNRDFQNKLNSVAKQRILFPDAYHYLDSNRCKSLNLALELDTLKK